MIGPVALILFLLAFCGAVTAQANSTTGARNSRTSNYRWCHNRYTSCPTTPTGGSSTSTGGTITTPTTQATTTSSTNAPSGGNPCVLTGDSGLCNFPDEPYITGVAGKPYVGANVWSQNPNYKFTLTAYAPNHWSTTVNVNTHWGGVQSYPNTGWNDNATPIDNYSSITSSWNVMIPTDTSTVAGWAGYDLWFNNWGEEVMIQPDITTNSYYQCSPKATATFAGQAWHLCVFGSERVWKIGTDDNHITNEPSGSVDVLAMLKWMESNGYLSAGSAWTAASFGFEVADTEGTTQTFTVNNFTWAAS